MSRIQTMSRFAEPDETKPYAICEECETELYEGDDVYVEDYDLIFCSTKCVAEAYCSVETLGENL